MVVAGKYDIIVENHEFKVVSKDKSDDRYIGISLEKFYHDPSLISIEIVLANKLEFDPCDCE